MSHDVARSRAISVRVEQTVDRRQLARRASVHCRDVVPQVTYGAGASGDEPAAESPIQWIALIDVPRYAVECARIRPCRGEHQQARDSKRVAGDVAAEALELPFELLRCCRISPLFQRIEDDTVRVVVCGDLEH